MEVKILTQEELDLLLSIPIEEIEAILNEDITETTAA